MIPVIKRQLPVLILLLLITSVNGQSLEIRTGQNIRPGDYAAIRYEQPTDTRLNFSAKIFINSNRFSGLHYTSYGLDLLAECSTNPDKNSDAVFALNLGLGGTVEKENEPWVYGNLKSSKTINYGIAGELTGEWAMSTLFSLTAFAQQKYLFNKDLGSTRFVFGLGLKINFGN